MQFLKMFGLGILYALLFPFLCVALALFAVYGVIVFLVEFIIMVVHFFSGKKLFPPFPEDQKAYQILLQLQQQQLAAANPQQPQTNVYVQQNYYTPHVLNTTRLVNNLLDMARIQSGGFNLKKEDRKSTRLNSSHT